MQTFTQIKALGRRLSVASKTITGSLEQVLWTGTRVKNGRQAVNFTNGDAALSLYIYLSQDPTNDLAALAADVPDYIVQPKASMLIHVCEDVDVLVCNSSGGGTTSVISGLEVGF